MEFLIGLGVVPLIIPFFILVTYLMKLLPSDFTLGAVVIMLVGDGVIAYTWYYSMLGCTEDETMLKRGIGLGFIIITFTKVLYLLIKQLKENNAE